MKKKPLVSIVILTWNKEVKCLRCIKSILDSNYNKLEIIVVDNNSSDNTCKKIQMNYPEVKLIRNKTNFFASEGRNVGFSKTKGEYIIFIDDDNVISENMIDELIKIALIDKRAGLLGPKMYYFNKKNIIWYAGATINLITSKTKYIGINSFNNKQFDFVNETGHVPNVIMVRRDVFKDVGGFDVKNFPMHYEEPDIAERIRKKGYKVIFVPDAVTFHDTPFKIWNSHGKGFALNDGNRTYFNFRNRILFMKLYGKHYFLFVLFFLPIFTLLYLIVILKIKRPKVIKKMFLGIRDGLFKRIK